MNVFYQKKGSMSSRICLLGKYHLGCFIVICALVIGGLSACHKETIDEDTSAFSEPGVYDVQIQVDTMKRWFKAIVPSGYDASVKHPLLLAYHGGGLSMGFMYNNRKDLIDRCEQENWVLVFPNGADFDDNRGDATWYAFHCCGEAGLYQADDIGFTKRIVDTLKAELNIDERRVYAIGGSNGAMLVHKIAVELPDIFAAVAENQGTAGGKRDTLEPFLVAEPMQPIPFILIHGRNDHKVQFNGGWTASTDTKRYDLSFAESVGIWATNNGCNLQPDTTVVQGLNGRVWIMDYNGCTAGADIRAIVIENKGHGWPSLESAGYDGTNVSIDFLKNHSK